MAYIFQEYPKNVNGTVFNSKEEEDNAKVVCAAEALKEFKDSPERFHIVDINNGAKRRFTKKAYLDSRFDPLPQEIFEFEYKCLECGREYSKHPRYLNAFKRHKESHELAMKIKYGNQ